MARAADCCPVSSRHDAVSSLCGGSGFAAGCLGDVGLIAQTTQFLQLIDRMRAAAGLPYSTDGQNVLVPMADTAHELAELVAGFD